MDKLIALAGTEHVKAYTRKDGTHVAAHTRVGGKFTVDLPDGTKATRSSKTHEYTHAVQVTNGGKHGVYRWSGSMKAAEAGRKEAIKYGFKDAKIVTAQKVEDAPKSAQKPVAKPSTPSPVKASDKPAQSAVETLKSKTSKPEGATPTKSVNYFKGRHPAPAFEVGERGITDRALQLWSDKKYRWRYYVNGKWVPEDQM